MSDSPNILIIDLESKTEEVRQMSNEEYQEFLMLQVESNIILEKQQQDIVKKEIAIAKLVALGLSEEDIKAVLN